MNHTPDVKALAEAIFLKSYRPDQYLTEQSEKYIITNIRNSIEVAELFYEILNEKKPSGPEN